MFEVSRSDQRETYLLGVEPSSVSADSRPDIDALRASLLRTVKYTTSPKQLDSVAEHVLVEQVTRRGAAPATVRDVLVTLVEEDHLDRIDGKHEPRYSLSDGNGAK